MDKQSKIVLISGPTASGKSNFAVKIAKKIQGEIINADSMQVYKILKILTARPNKIEQKDIKHHLYGVVDLNKKFSTGQWLELVIKKIRNIKKKKKIPILVGGTGLYFQSLINGLVKIPEIPLKFRNKVRLMSKREGQKKFYKKLLKLDPKVKDKFDPNDTQRSIRAYEIKSYTDISMYDWLARTESEFKNSDFLKLYIETKREKLIERINLRTLNMINGGAINEVKRFLKLKIRKDQSVNKVIGIDELTQYLNHEVTLDEAKELISIKTRQYAKRQATWARTRMTSWKKIKPIRIDDFIKKLK
ncbi:tRNA (adenosine(37)-N6)-dimethylallyltransferase MiaA [Candidatus Pelagibacter sp.]|nr:tRNA (adenosine(37)-N6)-dimethylallyltransferase MiaA [Candidatus Pelagibacter sp.]